MGICDGAAADHRAVPEVWHALLDLFLRLALLDGLVLRIRKGTRIRASAFHGAPREARDTDQAVRTVASEMGAEDRDQSGEASIPPRNQPDHHRSARTPLLQRVEEGAGKKGERSCTGDADGAVSPVHTDRGKADRGRATILAPCLCEGHVWESFDPPATRTHTAHRNFVFSV